MGIRVSAICLRLGTGLRGQRQGLACHEGRQGLCSYPWRRFFAVFCAVFCGSPQVRVRPSARGVWTRLFSSATSELKARSLHRDFTAGYRKELEQIEFRVSHLRLCFCLSRKATWRLGRGLPSKSLGCLVSCSSLLLVGVFSADTLSCGSGAAHLWL